MTPGWYNAQGDPAGTQRYWDGSQWIGEPVYEPAVAPTVGYPAPTYPPPGPSYPAAGGYHAAVASTFPGGLKVLAIIVSILKAIPLVFGAFAVLILGSFAESIDDNTSNATFNNEWDDLFRAIAAFLLVIILIGALLLGFQFAGALKERPMMIFIPAMIMSIVDSLSTIGAWAGFASSQGNSFDNQSPGGPVLITVITGLQIAIAVMALRAKN